MKIFLNIMFFLWLVAGGLLICATKEQDGQAMPIALLLLVLLAVPGMFIFPALYLKAYGFSHRWIVFAFIVSSLLCLNLFWASCAHDNYSSPSNWLNWSGFAWFCGGSITFLSILAAAFKLL